MLYKTIRQAYIDILIELVKEETPVLYIEDFLYYYNKAISEYMKFRYEKFEVTQQLTDDLRPWKKLYETSDLVINIDDIGTTVADGDNGTKLINLYRHLLNCIVNVTTKRPHRNCTNGGSENTEGSFSATRMTSDLKAELLGNEYLQPEFFRPYYDILNNKITIDLGSSSKTVIKSSIIQIEYLSQPTLVDMTAEQVEEDEDTTQTLEFPLDVYDEINKVALKLILERGMSPRLQSHMGVNQSINDLSAGVGQQRK